MQPQDGPVPVSKSRIDRCYVCSGNVLVLLRSLEFCQVLAGLRCLTRQRFRRSDIRLHEGGASPKIFRFLEFGAGGIQVTRSVWILDSDKEAAALRDEFNSFLDADDLLWINKLG